MATKTKTSWWKYVLIGFLLLILLPPFLKEYWSFTATKLPLIGLRAETKISEVLPDSIMTNAMTEFAKVDFWKNVNRDYEVALRTGDLDAAGKVLKDARSRMSKFNWLKKEAKSLDKVTPDLIETEDSKYPMTATYKLKPGQVLPTLSSRQNKGFRLTFNGGGGFYLDSGLKPYESNGVNPWVAVAEGITSSKSEYSGGTVVVKGGYYNTKVTVTVY